MAPFVQAAPDTYTAVSVLGQPDLNSIGINRRTGLDGGEINGSYAVIPDPAHNRVFVSENSAVKIFPLGSNGQPSSLIPTAILGQTTITGADTPTVANATTFAVSSLGYDATNQRLFVGDANNARILVFNLAGGISNGMAATNVLGQPDFTSSAYSGVDPTTFGLPTGIHYDASQSRLFVADRYADRIIVFDLSGGLTDGMPATWVLGAPDLTTDGSGTCSTTSIATAEPNGIAYDPVSQRLFTVNGPGAIQVFDLSSGITNGMASSAWLGSPGACGIFTTSQNQLWSPAGVSYNATTQRLAVADRQNNRVMVYDLSGGLVDGMNASLVLGQSNFATAIRHTKPNKTSAPTDVRFDSTHNLLWVADSGNNRVLTFDLSGSVSNGMNATNVLGQYQKNGTPNFYTSGFNPQPEADTLAGPWDITIDSVHHRMFVCDVGNGRILVYALGPQNQILSTTASNLIGQISFTASSGASDPANDELFGGYNVTYDPTNDRLFVTYGLYDRVLVYDLSGGITPMMAPVHVIGAPDFTKTIAYPSRGTPATAAKIGGPAQMIYDVNTQRLFISDWDYNRVGIYDLSGGITDGMGATYVLGQPDKTSSASGRDAVSMDGPGGLYLDSLNRLYVADYNNARVLVYDLAGGISDGMPASHVLGQADFTAYNYSASQTTMMGPNMLSFDPGRGRLFVTDVDANRVVYYDVGAGITDGMPATGVIGQPDFTSTTPSINAGNGFDQPTGVHFDVLSQRLYVASESQNRVVGFVLGSAATPTPSLTPTPAPATHTPKPTTKPRTATQTPAPSPQTVSPQPSSGPGGAIQLIEYPSYASGRGEVFDVAPGQQFVAPASGGGSAVFTVEDRAGLPSLSVTSGDGPERSIPLAAGRPVTSDLDGDGQPDITSTFTNRTDNGFRIVFASYKRVSAVQPTPDELPLLERLAKQIPVPVWLGFPWLVFILLGAAMLILARSVAREAARVAQFQALMKRQTATIADKSTFIQLASHYLRTPLTLIKAGADSLADPTGAAAMKLKQGATDLSASIDRLLKSAESGVAPIHEPEKPIVPPAVILSRWVFWGPIIVLCGLVAVFNILASFAGAGQFALVNSALGVAAIIVLAAGAYVLLRRQLVNRRLHELTRDVLEAQARLDDERNRFINGTVSQVTETVARLTPTAATLADDPMGKSIRDGLARLTNFTAKLSEATALKLATAPQALAATGLAQILASTSAIQAAAQSKGVQLQLPEDHPILVSDPARFGQVLASVIDNAVAYTPAGGQVSVTLDRLQPAQLTVTDTGKGIPDEFAKRLFEPFTKAEGALQFDHEGAGLSLYLDRVLMSYLGGTIAISSTPGQGTTVRLNLS